MSCDISVVEILELKAVSYNALVNGRTVNGGKILIQRISVSIGICFDSCNLFVNACLVLVRKGDALGFSGLTARENIGNLCFCGGEEEVEPCAALGHGAFLLLVGN